MMALLAALDVREQRSRRRAQRTGGRHPVRTRSVRRAPMMQAMWNGFFRTLVNADHLFKLFRTSFLGQNQSGPFLPWRRLRSGGDAVFGAQGARYIPAASPDSLGPRDARSLFA